MYVRYRRQRIFFSNIFSSIIKYNGYQQNYEQSQYDYNHRNDDAVVRFGSRRRYQTRQHNSWRINFSILKNKKIFYKKNIFIYHLSGKFRHWHSNQRRDDKFCHCRNRISTNTNHRKYYRDKLKNISVDERNKKFTKIGAYIDDIFDRYNQVYKYIRRAFSRTRVYQQGRNYNPTYSLNRIYLAGKIYRKIFHENLDYIYIRQFSNCKPNQTCTNNYLNILRPWRCLFLITISSKIEHF